MENKSVIVINEKLDHRGILVNLGFVLGLTVGRKLSEDNYGKPVIDGDGLTHDILTNLGHIVRKTKPSKLAKLRNELANIPEITVVVDYTEDASTSSYDEYTKSLNNHKGQEIVYRGVALYGPVEIVDSLTSKLSMLGQ